MTQAIRWNFLIALAEYTSQCSVYQYLFHEQIEKGQQQQQTNRAKQFEWQNSRIEANK